MAKRRKSIVGNFNRDLPTPEDTSKTVAKVTKKESTPKTQKALKKTFGIEDTKKAPRPKAGTTRKGRVKYTTMIHPDLKILLQNVANNNAISAADALELIIKEYFNIE